MEIPHQGPFCDLIFSEADDIDYWAVSNRGAGWCFGRIVTKTVQSIYIYIYIRVFSLTI